jgi:aspartyl-tRNA(Asn)/glutamyl-tRNA(Gln) amidotransferase subunit A
MRCGNRLDAEVEAAVTAAMRRAEALRWSIEPIELNFVALEPAFLVILRSALLVRLGARAATVPGKFDATLLATMEAGRGYSATDLCDAQFARTACFTRVQDVFARYDLMASPTLSAPPLPVGFDPTKPVAVAGGPPAPIRGAWYPYTYPFNLTGHPALSMPAGLSTQGLPIGLQLVGRWHEDDFLLDAAQRLEAATPLRPPFSP